MRCGLCQESFSDFLLGRCPSCGSKPAHRLEFLFLSEHLKLEAGHRLLAVAPSEPELRALLRGPTLGEAKLTVVDNRPQAHHALVKPPHRVLEMDVTHLSFSEQCFELVLCGGVLPFVRSDYLAISEAHRCLKNDGLALLSAPVPLPKTRRVGELRAEQPEQYTEAYTAEHGTEWAYGEDLFERIEAAGFFSHRLPAASCAGASVLREQGIPPALELILCFKFRDGREAFLKKRGWRG